ncbi:MAG: phenylalanine--tRNA ligase subunit beta [Deltaproteobacteria bacterium]|nr:phenylalanine--tRNA ligase subunit beta [Deltaproteobacteria bacterium]MBW2577606.1 phenylalanine--tRNA ligase subunit beta [Deltaproteobacteria bacterium]
MRISLEWLGEFIDLPAEADLVERLTLGGFEDVEVNSTGPDLSAIRVGRVLECGQHPNADRLSVCRVDIGDGEPIEVVCGAPNVAAGQNIAFAAVGTALPDGTVLKRAKIRGVVSTGMICSDRELQLGDDHDGILVLDPDAPIGAPLPDVISTGDRELDVGLTPNRGDATSVIGLAREVKAHFGGELRISETDPPETGPPAADAINVEIDATEDCHRYVARIVRGVRVGASPDWVVAKLAASGIRAINNVVDVTNLVLLEFGQPLHAFDLAKLHGGCIKVRRATTGEKLATLDGEARELCAEDLVIADSECAIALAGVMGGANTEVGDATTDILIESAHFHPSRVRVAAKRYGLKTEASYRFERGVDRLGIQRAADRAARLIAELAGGEVAAGSVVAEGAAPTVTEEVRFPTDRANRLLGTALSKQEMAAVLERVGVSCTDSAADELVCAIPSHRTDLHLHQDLSEEVARIYGYDRIPVTEPVGVLRGVERPRLLRVAERSRDALVAAGMTECQTLPFVNPEWLEALQLDPDDPRGQAVRLINPIREEEPLLRTTLLPSILRLVQQNRSRQIGRIEVFELASVFRVGGAPSRWGGDLPQEPLSLVAAIAEREEKQLWEAPNSAPLFFKLKGIAKKLLNQLGYVAWFPSASLPPYLHPGAAAALEVEGVMVGSVGELHPDVATAFGLDVGCAVMELDLEALEALPRQEHQFREVSRQPSVRRDLAVVVDIDQPAGEVLEAIRKTGGKDLILVELFDRYAGKGIADGRTSLAFRLVFQRFDRTLKDEEVTKSTDRIVKMLAHRFKGELR